MACEHSIKRLFDTDQSVDKFFRTLSFRLSRTFVFALLDKICPFRYNQNMFLLSGFLDLLCPPVCPICNGLIENPTGKELFICSGCIQNVVTPDGQFCRRCGSRRAASANTPDQCTRCQTSRFRFKRAIALGEYKDGLRLLVLRMKTDKTGILAISAARTFLDHRRTDLEAVQADYILPIPMHRYRREERGVNSPDILAEIIGQQLNIPVVPHLVRRIRQTDLQHTLSQRSRANNIRDAFAVHSPNLLSKLIFRQSQPPLTGKTVLLVDDILTTGSTCNEVTKVLRASGIKSVMVAVLARAEGRTLQRF